MADTYIYGTTHQGMVRTNNEDTYIVQYVWDDRYILCAAIDGIGGYEGGEVAAAIAKDAVIQYVEANRGSNCLSIIKQALIEANNDIVRQKEINSHLTNMGCVATAAIIDIDDAKLYMAHVGDTRLYSYSNGVLTKLSHDHSLVGLREEIGDLTEYEAMHHPQRNLIERSLGEEFHMFEDRNFVDASIIPITSSTTFLFCSDGLSDMLTSAQITNILQNAGDVTSMAGQLIATANEMGGKDNVTVVLAQVDVASTLVSQSNTSDNEDLLSIHPDHPKSDINVVATDHKQHHNLSKWFVLIVVVSIIVVIVLIVWKFLHTPDERGPVTPDKVQVVEKVVQPNELDTTQVVPALTSQSPDSI